MTSYTFFKCNWVFAFRGGCWIISLRKYDIRKIDYSDKFFMVVLQLNSKVKR